MEADFQGYATKANVLCSDGRTILPDAFKHQDGQTVPLVWHHGHASPENVLGHAVLENRADGVWARCFFNESPTAQLTHGHVQHGDITRMSIWANNLVESAGRIARGVIREVSLVISGANPEARIERVAIRHSDGGETTMDDEAIIHSGVEFLIPIEEEDDLAHSDGSETVQDVYDSMDETQKTVLHYMLGMALEEAAKNQAAHGETTNGDSNMANVFEQGGASLPVLSHADVQGIFADATKTGSFRDSVHNYALAHGIENIDVLFPDAQALNNIPEWIKRRTEWVGSFIAGTRKSPFSRIKTLTADLTFEEARAKGYVKGNFKKEEFFKVAFRVTTPTTIYKKQKLDRDDVVDITGFDVIAWLRLEMRLMLDEELARAILIGDGREIDDEDKIKEEHIRPIISDDELYVTTVNILAGPGANMNDVVDAVIMNRQYYKGSGMPNLYTTETVLARFLTMRDTLGRRIYRTLDELATELRVASIIPVEVMETIPDLLGIIVNPADYVLGADRGGEVSMFDDFDIDYNQMKYLIETRVSGALTRVKAAIVLRNVAGDGAFAPTSVTPDAPTYNSATGQLTITDTAGVVYKNGAGTVLTNAGSPYTVVAGTTYDVFATPEAGYFFPNSEVDDWSFTRPA